MLPMETCRPQIRVIKPSPKLRSDAVELCRGLEDCLWAIATIFVRKRPTGETTSRFPAEPANRIRVWRLDALQSQKDGPNARPRSDDAADTIAPAFRPAHAAQRGNRARRDWRRTSDRDGRISQSGRPRMAGVVLLFVDDPVG